MRSFIARLKNEEGNVMVIAFVLLVVLTLLGIFATRSAQIDLLVAYNEIPYRQNFYIAEGGVNREAAELGTASPGNVKSLNDNTYTDRSFLNNAYTYSYLVHSLGEYVAPKGYSAIHFSRYDYDVRTKAGGTAASGEVNVAARVYKVGPKAE